MIEVEVVGIRLEVPTNQPVLILRDLERPRYLPLWIGTAEATAITLSLEGVVPPRPLTHDLLADVIENLGAVLTSVTINQFVDGVFMAVLQFANHESISARPSDAVALAVRLDVAVFVESEVMDEAALDIDEEMVDENDDPIDPQVELDKFRAFLDEINPEDFSN